MKIAIRNLFKNKLFSIINLLGMSVSLACVFIITLFVTDELKYDRHIADAENKFRIYNYCKPNIGAASDVATRPHSILHTF